MTFEEILPGAYRIGLSPHADARGFFARTVCEDTLAGRGLVGRFRQSSVSFNVARGTVRGLHYAVAPHAETKLVRCTMGAIHDVIVDLRRSSPTYLRAAAVELSAGNRAALYIPAGFAHGFQTRADDTEVLYMIDRAYVAEAARGVRWDDPALTVTWPEPVRVIAERDRTYDWLRSIGLQAAPSDANFVLFGTFDDRHSVWQGLLDRGVLIRETGPDGWLRVSIGTPDEMAAFRTALTEVLG